MHTPPNDPGIWEVLQSSYVFRKPPWLTLRLDHVRLPSGATIPEYVVLEYPEWLNIVAVTDDNQIVMVRQYRHGLRRVDWELPGGVRDAADPTLEAAARRELLEETGFGGGTWQHLMTLSANPSTNTNLNHSFLARGVIKLREHAQEQTEDIHVHLLPIEQVREIVLNDGMVQSLNAAPLLKFLVMLGS
ncbi:MAG TPA: NUDIX hydrolase [Tepidisphaeraceae bacterium]|jgi:8-oxo-dGTP pyrophosphatase MutT (NUDIX family)